MKKYKVLIVEDDLGISNSLKLYLENSGYNTNVLNTGKNAVEEILNGNYDIVILDINLPVKDGLTICKEVRESNNTPIIMLTARNDRIAGFELGADDYMSKPFSPKELIVRIQSILRRLESLSTDQKDDSGIYEIHDLKINHNELSVSKSGKEINLTKNEFEIFYKIISEDGNVIKRETLMKDIIGYDNYAYDRTIDTHIKNIRRKIGDKDLILTIRGVGYRLNK